MNNHMIILLLYIIYILFIVDAAEKNNQLQPITKKIDLHPAYSMLIY